MVPWTLALEARVYVIWGVFWLDECGSKCRGPTHGRAGHSNSISLTNTNTETAIVAVD